MKIHPVGAELFHAGGQMDTDRHDEAVTFHNFANSLKMNLKIKHAIIREGIIVHNLLFQYVNRTDDKECKEQNNTQHTITMF
jgi:hypothetical protein